MLTACAPRPVVSGYDRLATTLRMPAFPNADVREWVRYAALAANGHNTQAWRFAWTPRTVTILPDFGRRTPVVDPDDHHLFVSLGCASENLSLAAEANGRPATISFQPKVGGRIHIDLDTSVARASALFDAIPKRQSTRSVYTGGVVAKSDLRHLEAAARIDGVSVEILTDRPKLDTVRDFVVHGNSLQLEDHAFMRELKSWISFNRREALARRDGLFSGCSGSPEIPTWVGEAAFSLLFVEKSENDKYARQIASSSGVAVFVGDKADPDHWTRVGRSVQRFALQATALGLKYAVINQPVEVPSIRAEFAKWLGIGAARPDFVLRFGYGQPMPMSLRRSVDDIVAHS
ncbi:Acg family FMN-binding oxidoreductase [Asticcacaulis sp. MM231]|uniref:Acg family FMN-binding oxidoreductase n=1 Tax=Asticcacaulis sp. MM231 TaxID=3157666 RepID=UPI0032D5942A